MPSKNRIHVEPARPMPNAIGTPIRMRPEEDQADDGQHHRRPPSAGLRLTSIHMSTMV